MGGRAETLYAPAYAASRASREALLAHGDVRETLSHAAGATIALVGIGDARDDSAVVRMGCFSTREMARMRRAGAVGDLLGFFFGLDGASIVPGIGDRVVGLDPGQLRAIPTVIALASEPTKYARRARRAAHLESSDQLVHDGRARRGDCEGGRAVAARPRRPAASRRRAAG